MDLQASVAHSPPKRTSLSVRVCEPEVAVILTGAVDAGWGGREARHLPEAAVVVVTEAIVVSLSPLAMATLTCAPAGA